MSLKPCSPPSPRIAGRGPYSSPPSPELGELNPDPVRVLDVRVAAPGLLHLEDHGMARLRRLCERGVEVLDRESEVVQPVSDRVGCVERAALLVVVQLEGVAALSLANEFDDSPLRRVNGVSPAHLHSEKARVELHGRLEVLHANAGVKELGLHGLGTPEVCRWIKSFSVPVLGAEYGPCPRVSTGSAAEDDPSIEASNQGEGRSRGAS